MQPGPRGPPATASGTEAKGKFVPAAARLCALLVGGRWEEAMATGAEAELRRDGVWGRGAPGLHAGRGGLLGSPG